MQNYTGVAAGSSGLGLLVCAQQDTVVALTSSVSGIVPFATEVFDPSNLFSGGSFTPAVTGTYRVDCLLAISASGSLSFYSVEFWEGSAKLCNLFATDSYVGYATNSYRATLPLASGVAYSIRVSCGGTAPAVAIGSGVKNTLSIERLS